MKVLKLFFVIVLATTLAGTAWSQSASVSSTTRILGYLDPINNSFQPLGMQSSAGSAPAAVPISVVTGKIVTTFTIKVQSVLPQTSSVSCLVQATVTDPTNLVSEQAAAIATRSPGTAKCTVTIPYSWRLETFALSTDRLIITYIISTVPSSTQPGLVFRTSSQIIANGAVPKTGTTTTETVAATI